MDREDFLPNTSFKFQNEIGISVFLNCQSASFRLSIEEVQSTRLVLFEMYDEDNNKINI